MNCSPLPCGLASASEARPRAWPVERAPAFGGDGAGPGRRATRKQHEVAAAFLGAGGETAADGGAGDVARKQDAAVKLTHVGGRARLHGVHDDLAEKFGVDAPVGGGVERHATKTRFEHA